MTRRSTVLLEHPRSLVLLDHREQLEAAGFDVLTCRGPRSFGDGTCPLVTHGDCPLAARADVIVNMLERDCMCVYAAERVLLPDVPVCLACSDDDRQRVAELLADTHVAPTTIGGWELVKVVTAALGTGRPAGSGEGGRQRRVGARPASSSREGDSGAPAA